MTAIWIFLWLSATGFLDLAIAQGIRDHGADDRKVFLYTFTRNGERHETVVITAGGAFEMEVPVATPSKCVSLIAAMPFNLGDGAVLKVAVGEGANQKQIAELSLDPVHIRAHRAWVPLRFDIPEGLNLVRIRFEAGPGFRGDFTGDWIGLAPGHEKGCLLTAP